MSIWKDVGAKAGTVIAGEKKTVLAWAAAHKGWLVTTGASHVLGWAGSWALRHLL